MPLRDSVDKIVQVYFASVTARPFSYKNELFRPKPLLVSPLLLRGYTCPSGCGGCCPRFSLDYLPSEEKPPGVVPREVRIDGRIVEIFSDMQTDGVDHFCKHLGRQDGRCTIYRRRPFSCDFELIRFLIYEDRVVHSQQLFGRGWNMRRVDGGRGAQCTMTVPNSDTKAEVIRKLQRLEVWATYFGIQTRVAAILDWIQRGNTEIPLRIPTP